MGKTSLANTFAEFLKSPKKDSKPVLTKGTALEFTKVMQLYDGLSVDQKTEIEVQLEDFPRNESVKLVKLKMDQEEGKKEVPQKAGKRERFKKIFTSLFTRANGETLLADEEKRKREETEDDVETTDPDQEKPADAPGEKSARAPDEKSDDKSPARDENKNDVQLKLVDMGGHSATVV